MNCQKCDSYRVISLSGKTADRCFVEYQDQSYDGYPPRLPAISNSDYISVSICLECGQTQGLFPQPTPEQFEERS